MGNREKGGHIMMRIENVRIKIEENAKLSECFFLCAFACYYFYLFLGSTMFDVTWFVPFYRVSVIMAMLVIAIKVVDFRREEWKDWLIAIVILVCTGVYWFIRKDKAILILGIFIVAAKDVSFKKITQVALTIGIGIMVSAFIASQVGLIEDLIYFQRGAYRHSFGVSYTTDFAAHVLFLVMGFFCLKNGRLKVWQYGVFLTGTFTLYYFTRARNSVICLVFLIFFTGMYQFVYCRKQGEQIWGRIIQRLAKLSTFAFIVCPAIMILLTFGYDKSNKWLKLLNQLLSGRLEMGYRAYIDHGLSLWGKVIPQMGLGRTVTAPEFYFYLDSSYIMVLLEKGIVIFSLICFLFVMTSRKNYKKNLYIIFVLVIVALHCIVEHHIIDISYNYFLLLALSKVDFPWSGSDYRAKEKVIKQG